METEKTTAKLSLFSPKESKQHNNDSAAMSRKGVYAASSYMATAVLLVMFNKAALSSYGFPYANVITLFQLVTMESVRAINVPMYTTIRRTTVAFTMLVEYLLTGKKHSVPVIGSVGIIILGALIAGARDLSFDPYSYGVVFAANICTAIYLASIARIGKSSGLNSFGLMWCNGVICLPALLIWTSVSGDIGALRNFPYLLFPGFQVVSLLSCILAFLINYFVVFLNTTINSALTQTICGNLKDVFTIGLGWMLFGGLPFDMMNLVGQTLGFLGSLLYAYSKLKGK
ncbi:UDP-N-acetylglucosamine transporter UGNT1 [Linum perenne]